MIPGPIDSTTATAGLARALETRALEDRRGSDAGFSDLVTGVLQRANELQHEATTQAQKLAAGEGDIVESLLALSRADLSLRFVVSMRNRALDAYDRIMRLQV
ncbi:MAG: flagellar hook-basal body complex protein FliE [Myxococcota bacterium]